MITCLTHLISCFKHYMFTPKDIHPLTDFQRNAKMHIERLKETGRPEILTVNGRAEVIVQDADAYQRMLDEINKLETIAAVSKALEQVREGKTKPAEQALNEMRKKLKVPKHK